MEDAFSALPADALVTLVLALPLDERARCAVLARRFRDLLCPRGGVAHVALRRRLDFAGCAAKVSADTLKLLVLRCGGELRVVNINAPCCDNIALVPALLALRALRPSAVEEVDLREPLQELIFDAMGYSAGKSAKRMFTTETVGRLREACPALRAAAYTVIAPPPPRKQPQPPLPAAVPLAGVASNITLYGRINPPIWEIECGQHALHGHSQPRAGTYCPLRPADSAYEDYETDEAVCALCASLEGAGSVTQLVLHAYGHTYPEEQYNVSATEDAGVRALARLLRHPGCAINTLVLNDILRDDGVEEESIAELASALRACAPLREIHLAGNEDCVDFDSLLAACAAHTPPVRVVLDTPDWKATGRPEHDFSW